MIAPSLKCAYRQHTLALIAKHVVYSQPSRVHQLTRRSARPLFMYFVYINLCTNFFVLTFPLFFLCVLILFILPLCSCKIFHVSLLNKAGRVVSKAETFRETSVEGALSVPPRHRYGGCGVHGLCGGIIQVSMISSSCGSVHIVLDIAYCMEHGAVVLPCSATKETTQQHERALEPYVNGKQNVDARHTL